MFKAKRVASSGSPYANSIKSGLPKFPLKPFWPERPKSQKPQTLREPAREIPVFAEADVVVLGGGPAGCCAAAAAARSGARTVLIERYGFFGGMATAANVNIWHSLWSINGETQVIGGLPQEIIERLIVRDAAKNSKPNGRGYYVICSETSKFVFDDVVIGSGVKVILHAMLADVVHGSDGKIEAAIIETKSGRGAVKGQVFVDCTGDADLCARANVPHMLGDEDGRCQPPTLCFRLGGLDVERVKDNNLQKELFKGTMDYNDEKYSCFLWSSPGVWRKDEKMYAGVRVSGVNCSNKDDFTKAEIEGRYQARWILERLKALPGFEKAHFVDVATQIGVRETRRIHGEHLITEDELLQAVPFEDAIAQGTYPVDIHNPDGAGIIFRSLNGTEREVKGNGEVINRRWDGKAMDAPKREAPCYYIPYRSLIPKNLTNVLAAGRCISATHGAAGGLRVMVNAMSFGEAAGTAAAMAARYESLDVRDVSTAGLRQKLITNGVPLLDVQVVEAVIG